MRKLIFPLLILLTGYRSTSQTKQIHLPNGWSLSPVGKSLQLGDLPLNIAVSPSKKLIAVTNNGQSTQSIQLIDAINNKILHSVEIPKSWLGLKFSADEKYLYASGGNDNRIIKYAVVNNKLALKDSILLGGKWPEKISPAGFDIDDTKKKMYVVTKENNSLYTIDLKTKSIIQKDTLGAESYTCLLSRNKSELYISVWGGDRVAILNTQSGKFSGSIPVGDNPNDLCISPDNHYLFVANANDNSVSVIDLKKRTVIETLNAALYPNSVPGSTTNSVALSADGKTLYIANADNNCLAIFDVSKPGSSKSKGFIPVGWYPTCVRIAGTKIFVTNGKGYTSLPNPHAPGPYDGDTTISYHQGSNRKVNDNEYIGGLFKGTLSIINPPTAKQLGAYSRQVYANTPYNKEKELQSPGEAGNPIPVKIGDTSPIKHVF
ncbi:MAG: YncE family protein, partial [Bacteroidota bacterium]